jgi:hypothetical protein
MTPQPLQSRLVTILWFVAAALAFLAAGLRLSSGAPPGIGVIAGGSFCLIMGIASAAKGRRPPQP